MKNRIVSIDVLRGLTIAFMIIVNTPGSWSHVYPPLLHAKWHGCTPTDLVFPFFLFIVGVSMAFSFSNYKSKDRHLWFKKILRRTSLIFLIGLLLNWFPFYTTAYADLRLFGVLQRIGIAFGGAGLLVLYFQKSYLKTGIIFLILLGYWGVLYSFGGSNPYGLESNFCTRTDLYLFGENHLYNGFGIPFDPEGLLSALPGIAHVLIGFQIGTMIKNLQSQKKELLQYLLLIGTMLVIIGQIWNLSFPINKPLWTSSYVMYTCGLATLLLTLLIWILDIKKWNGWAYPFKVFGFNPLASYVLSVLLIKIIAELPSLEKVDLYSLAYREIFQQIISPAFGSFLQAFCFTAIVWFLAWLLYRKGKVIKI